MTSKIEPSFVGNTNNGGNKAIVIPYQKPTYTCFTPYNTLDWTVYGGIWETLSAPNCTLFGTRFEEPLFRELGDDIIAVQVTNAASYSCYCDPLFCGLLSIFVGGFACIFSPFYCPYYICAGDLADLAEIITFFPFEAGYALEHRRKGRKSETLLHFIQDLQSVEVKKNQEFQFYELQVFSYRTPDIPLTIRFDLYEGHPHLESFRQLASMVNNKIRRFHRDLSTAKGPLIIDGIDLRDTQGFVHINTFGSGFRRDSGLSFQSPEFQSGYAPFDGSTLGITTPITPASLLPFLKKDRSCCPLFQVDWLSTGGFVRNNCPLIDTECVSWQNRRRFGDILYADEQRLILHRDVPIQPGFVTCNTNLCILNLVSLGLYSLYVWSRSIGDILVFWKAINVETKQPQLNVSMIRRTFTDETVVWTDYDIRDVEVSQATTPILAPSRPYVFMLVLPNGERHDISNIPLPIHYHKWYRHEEQNKNYFGGNADQLVDTIRRYIPNYQFRVYSPL
jgi:hypothetical protein